MPITSDSFPNIKIGITGAMILIIVAITVPSLIRAGGAEQESSTIGTLKMLNMACAEYSTTFGQYPAALSDLLRGPNGGLSSTAADLIDSSLATGMKDGYVFTFIRGAAGAGYSISARPVKGYRADARFFFTDQSGSIRFTVGHDADASATTIQ